MHGHTYRIWSAPPAAPRINVNRNSSGDDVLGIVLFVDIGHGHAYHRIADSANQGIVGFEAVRVRAIEAGMVQGNSGRGPKVNPQPGAGRRIIFFREIWATGRTPRD
ncbi:hypothetical protein D3C85_1522960 [compost metagenome]